MKRFIIGMMVLSITVCSLFNFRQSINYIAGKDDGEIEVHGDKDKNQFS